MQASKVLSPGFRPFCSPPDPTGFLYRSDLDETTFVLLSLDSSLVSDSTGACLWWYFVGTNRQVISMINRQCTFVNSDSFASLYRGGGIQFQVCSIVSAQKVKTKNIDENQFQLKSIYKSKAPRTKLDCVVPDWNKSRIIISLNKENSKNMKNKQRWSSGRKRRRKREHLKIPFKILWLFILSFVYVKYSTSDPVIRLKIPDLD